jgi:hypothetical protein
MTSMASLIAGPSWTQVAEVVASSISSRAMMPRITSLGPAAMVGRPGVAEGPGNLGVIEVARCIG